MFIGVDFMLGGNIDSGGYSLNMRWMLGPSICSEPAVGPSAEMISLTVAVLMQGHDKDTIRGRTQPTQPNYHHN